MAKKTFDKEQWLADTRVRVERAKQALEAGLTALQTSADWKRTLAAMAALGPARLGRLSFRNALLVLTERPDARHVATFGAVNSASSCSHVRSANLSSSVSVGSPGAKVPSKSMNTWQFIRALDTT